jgi:hypothetical protein
MIKILITRAEGTMMVDLMAVSFKVVCPPVSPF